MSSPRSQRLLRIACALYPRDFRRLLLTDMEELFAREIERRRRDRGRWAAGRYALATILRVALGTVPARVGRLASLSTQLETLLQDGRFAVRNLQRAPGFTTVATLSLALGIGANTAIFSVVDSVLLRGMPFPDSERIVALWEHSETIGGRTGVSGATFLDWRDRTRAYEDMILFQPGTATITSLDEPEQVPGMRVTANFLAMLGATLAHGRDFLPSEARGGRADVAVVSDGFWQRAWGGSPDALGSQIIGDHTPYTLVGVLAPDFWFPLRADLFVPWDEDELAAPPRSVREYGVLARLRPGVTIGAARAELEAIAAQIESEQADMAGWGIEIGFAHEESTAAIRPALLVLLAAVGFVLLIACANVANLVLARSAQRQAEIATRAALGASRGRLVRQLLTESLLLSLAGGLLGLGLGHAGVRLLGTVLPPDIPMPDGNVSILLPAIAVDVRVMLFTAVAAMATGVLFGLAPALQTASTELTASLRAERGGSPRSARIRDGLVSAELALAVVLLAGTGLMIRTLWNLSAVDPGFRPSGVVTMQIELPTDSRYSTDPEQVDFYQGVLEGVRAIPGVESAGISEVLPLDNATRRLDVSLVDAQPSLDAPAIGVDYNIVDPGFFETLEVPLVRGRLFDAAIDQLDTAWVALVDTTFAERFLAGRDPIGERVRAWRVEMEIVGVVGPVRSAGLEERPRPTIYFHYQQAPDNLMSFVARTAGEPAGLVESLKGAVRQIDPDQPIFNVRRMDGVVAAGSTSRRLTLLLLSIFGAVALFMAALGVYGVMAHAIGRRTRELGLRKALGADRGRLLAMVLREALRLAARGIGAGVLASIAVARGMSSLLYGVRGFDTLALALVAALLLAVALVAAALPARRAARVDPVDALRLG